MTPDENTANGTPPRGRKWGEQTKQGLPCPPADAHTDADEIRRRWGIDPLDLAEFQPPKAKHEGQIVYPDMLIHESDPERTSSSKGTDCLFRGARDCGKTTLARALALRLLHQNGEKVVWRGRQGGSGWLPLRHWATVFVPSDCGVSGYWKADGDDLGVGDQDAIDDLETVVREVQHYDGIEDLLSRLAAQPDGTLNVVYPDPLFRDCERITKLTDRGQFAGTLPFTSVREATEDQRATPVTDWWVPFLVGRAEHGPFDWTSWICDEAGDLFPQGAKNEDDRPLHDLVHLLRAVWATSRKRKLSLFMFVHYEENLHHLVRREFKWRVHMPDGTRNPIAGNTATHPVGFKNDIPMTGDLISNEATGTALCYDTKRFTRFKIPHIHAVGADADRWLSIRLDGLESGAAGGSLSVAPENAGSTEARADGSGFIWGGEADE